MCMKFGLLILGALVWFANAREICDTYGFTYTYCEDGYYCCYNDTQCCTIFWSVGVIVGVVIGGLVGLGVLIVFCVVCVCGHGKSRASAGNVITPASGTQMNVITTGYAQPGPGYVPPPGYSQHGYGVSGSQPPPLYPPQPDSQQKEI